MSRFVTKKWKIYEYMKDHPEGITSMKAFELCKATRLAAIVYDLKNRDGYNIMTVMKQNPEDGSRYAEYRLVG